MSQKYFVAEIFRFLTYYLPKCCDYEGRKNETGNGIKTGKYIQKG